MKYLLLKLINFLILMIILSICSVSPIFGDETSGLCPQTRGTIPAPEEYATLKNPVPPSNENISGGKILFEFDAKPIPCATCHGFRGNGFGVIFQRMKPYPRDFTCYQTMNDVSDGQMFWIIKSGSHGTRMPAFYKLEDRQIWQLIHYIRSFTDKSLRVDD